MKHCAKTVLFALIAAVLCVCLLPQTTQAASVDDLTFTLNPNKKSYTLSGCDTAAAGDLVIPATYEGLPVTKIGNYAFDGCSELTSVAIPETVTAIGEYAFQNCTSMVSVTIPDGVTSIGMAAFADCRQLTSVVIPDSVTKLGIGAFNNCSGMTSLTISKGLKTIARQAFQDCDALTSVVIPEGVTRIAEAAFVDCSGLVSVTIPSTVTHIERYAFSDCTVLTDLVIPGSVTSIGEYAFKGCKGITDVTIPSSVTHIGVWGFDWCTFRVDKDNPAFSSDSRGVLFNKDKTTLILGRGAVSGDYVIPYGTKEISDWAFFGCYKLTSITVPDTVTSLGDYAFYKCDALTDVYYTGTEAQWRALMADAGEKNSPLFSNTVHYNQTIQKDALSVFTDRADLRLPVGDRITIRAAVVSANGDHIDPSGITFQVTDGSLVDVERSGFEEDSFYIQLRGVNPGITTVTFSDTENGYAVAVPITVYANTRLTYTLNNIPTVSALGVTANFANFNGLFVDSFTYRVNDDKTARVTFDAYNTNFSYSLVEVYQEDGRLCNAVLIDKMSNFNASLKSIYWDGSVCFVKALVKDTISDYRGGFVSKHTHVELDIPQNGYIRITCDPSQSDMLALINWSHLMVSSLSLMGEVKGFDPADVVFPETLTKNLLKDTAAEQFRKDGSKIFTNIMKDEMKELTITSKTVGDYLDTVSNQMVNFNGMKLISKSLLESGASFGEDVLTKMMGVYGVYIKSVFTIGKCEDLVLSFHDAANTIGGGAITIQNQGGGVRAATCIKLESEVDFAPDVALQVYSVELDQDFLDFVKKADQETYDILIQSICHIYNISLLKGQEKVQHNDYVTVYIPIPEDLRALSLAGNVRVYRIEEDGTLTDMDAVVEDGCMRFVTDHFSLYALVGEGTVPGDMDGNGMVNQDDAVYLLLHTMFGGEVYPLVNPQADVDGSGAVNQDDAIYLLLHAMFGWEVYPLMGN